jgi:hypothetical protein
MLPEEFSFGSSCNSLMIVSKAPICVFLSGHVLLQRDDTFQAILSVLDKQESAAVYLRQVPNSVFGSNYYERAYLSKRFPPGSGPVELNRPAAFSNAASALTRTAWERFPFPDLPASEDYAWARGHLARGGRLYYLPQIAAEHSHNESAEEVYHRVRINVEARGVQGDRWKAGKQFAVVFGAMILQGASPRESLAYAKSHSRAYL